jgi:hypothetical protein
LIDKPLAGSLASGKKPYHNPLRIGKPLLAPWAAMTAALDKGSVRPKIWIFS